MRLISYVVPVYNENESLRPLTEKILMAAEKTGYEAEIIYIDDKSTDGSLETIKELAAEEPRIRYGSLSRNMGQSAALYAGFSMSRGEIVVTMDADLQNDPADIPEMLKHYGEYQMVNGWRKNRKDSSSKRIASRFGNWLRNRMLRENLHDSGCSLKVMNGDMVRRIKMYDGLHRFLPAMMRNEGAKVIEVPVNHQARQFGKSKYTNLKRAKVAFYDLLSTRWMMLRHIEPEIKEHNDQL
ncbi:glycosyltransferase family 2 protein [Limisalsivibrio acetivorans]|uniref:glycosyltransferase family 2 protein n=1 Tax=Limisalsivibrio acetivorans TaxID=1304888 RepID=UPI0003B6D107|nr:glycosyltransferase family 2 protein [Limisalsivibrio acetivorans]